MASTVDVFVSELVEAPPDRVRRIMFDARQDPTWMVAVKRVELLTEDLRPGARVRRTGRFLGRTLRWTTEVTSVSAQTLDLQIVDGPMRGTVTYRIEPERIGSRVTIRNGVRPSAAPHGGDAALADRRPAPAQTSGGVAIMIPGTLA
jgi:uncharacterized membrane protein